MVKKAKAAKVDGISPELIKRIRSSMRLVWQRSYSRQLVVKRCTGEDGFFRCELCSKATPKIKIDHLNAVGAVDEGFIKRMFVPSDQLQGLCNKCHNEKTKLERFLAKKKGA